MAHLRTGGRGVAVLLLLALLAAASHPSSSRAATAAFAPVADSYVTAASPDANHGTVNTLKVDASPVLRSYLRFDVAGLGGTPSRAILRLTAMSSASGGVEARGVGAGDWDEQAITFANAPAPGPVVASSGPVTTGQVIDLDVTSLVKGPGPVSIALTTPGAVALALASREATAVKRARLLVDAGGDATAPAPTLTRPAAGSTTGAAPAFAGTAGTAPGDASAVTVLVRAGTTASGTLVRTLTATATDGTYAVTASPPLPDGAYTAIAEQSDAAGNTGRSAPVTFSVASEEVDTTLAPVADAYVDASAAATNFGTRDRLRADASPTVRSFVRFDVRGLGGGSPHRALLRLHPTSRSSTGLRVHAVSSTTWAEDSVTWLSAPVVGEVLDETGELTAGMPATVDVTPLVRGDGPMSLALTTTSANAVSVASREDVASTPKLVIRGATADTEPPAVVLRTPAAGATVKDSTPTFDGTAGSAATDAAEVAIRIHPGPDATAAPVQRLTAIRDAAGAFSADAEQALPDGTYTVVAEQSDQAGNVGTSDLVTFTVAAGGAPDVAVLRPVADGYTDASRPRTASGTAALRADASPVVRSFLRFDVPALASAPARATLKLRVTSPASAGLSLHAVPDTTWTESGLTHDTAPALGDVAATTGRVAADTTVSFDVSRFVPGDGPVAFAVTTPGATAVAIGSREGTDAGVPRLVLTRGGDTAPPEVTLSSPPAGPTSDATPTFAGTAGTAPGDDPTVTVRIYSGSSATGMPVQTLTATASSDGSYSVDARADLADGIYTAVAEQLDGAGNAGRSAERTVTIDRVAPAVTLTTPADATTTSDRTPRFAGAAGTAPGDADSVTVLLYEGESTTGIPLHRMTATRRGGSWEVDAPSPLEDDTFTVVARQVDAAGNDARTPPHTFVIGAASGEATFHPVADAYVTSAASDRNHGTPTELRVDSDPVVRSYLRFDVQGRSGPAKRAVLRIKAVNDGREGFRVHAVADSSWGETTITHANAPALGALVGSTGRAFGGEWKEVDVTSLVTGNGPVTIGLSTTYSTGFKLLSRESAHPPQLIVDPPAPKWPKRPTFPIRAAFYYPWFPNAWAQQGYDPFTRYTPSRGQYDSADPEVIEQHIRSMQRGGIEVGISSWWGRGHHTDVKTQGLLDAAERLGTNFRWAVYYEDEGNEDPTPEQISADLEHIKARYASHPNYLKINKRPVVFVYGGSETCSVTDRWATGNTIDAYLVQESFPGAQSCVDQPDAWHDYYGPIAYESEIPGHSYTISPGFWRVDEEEPRLARDLDAWHRAVRNMVDSNAPFQLVLSWNEWGEGSPVESAEEWSSASGHGEYVDALQRDGRPAGHEPVIAAAGDIACAPGSLSSCKQRETSDLLLALDPDAVLALGDVQYENGEFANFLEEFDPTWGRVKSRIRPVIGNHEYNASVGLVAGGTCDLDTVFPYACGYFDYFNGKGNFFGRAAARDKGFYAFDLGTWRLYAVNSNCTHPGAPGCKAGSAQEQWLRQDMAAHPRRCTLMFAHHPLFTSDARGFDEDPSFVAATKPLWEAFHDGGGDVVLAGHSHFYERFARQDPEGQPDAAKGFRLVIAGTGGKNLQDPDPEQTEPTSQVRESETFGVVRMRLADGAYDWRFVPIAGQSFTDSGSESCR